MKDYKTITMLFIAAILIHTLTSCTTYSSSLVNHTAVFKKDELKKGKTCSKNLLGGFTVPYIKQTDIRIAGSESIVDAIKNGGIEEVFVVDTSKKHFIFYTKKCTIVHGK
jgi:hypothetical protein